MRRGWNLSRDGFLTAGREYNQAYDHDHENLQALFPHSNDSVPPVSATVREVVNGLRR